MSSNQPMRLPHEIPEEAYEEELDAASDPSVAALAQSTVQAANDAPDEDVDAPTLPYPNTEALHVDLPVPLYHPVRGEWIETAEVRELNGEDEEYFVRGKNFHERKARMIESATVMLGEEKPDTTTLLALAQGSREALILAIRRATYGDDLEVDLSCPQCAEDQTAVIDLAGEIPIKTYESMMHTLELKSGRTVTFRWPTGDDENAIWKYWGKHSQATVAELNTQMLARVLDSINGQPSFGESSARKMNMRDRREIAEFLSSEGPGPKYDDLDYACSACGFESKLEVKFDDLFR